MNTAKALVILVAMVYIGAFSGSFFSNWKKGRQEPHRHSLRPISAMHYAPLLMTGPIKTVVLFSCKCSEGADAWRTITLDGKWEMEDLLGQTEKVFVIAPEAPEQEEAEVIVGHSAE